MPANTCLMSSSSAASGRRPSLMRLLQLMLGGAICGSFAGSFAGAILGTLLGVLNDNLSLGLDGAVLGSGVLALAGFIYGAVLGMRERKSSHHHEEGDHQGTPPLEQG